MWSSEQSWECLAKDCCIFMQASLETQPIDCEISLDVQPSERLLFLSIIKASPLWGHVWSEGCAV